MDGTRLQSFRAYKNGKSFRGQRLLFRTESVKIESKLVQFIIRTVSQNYLSLGARSAMRDKPTRYHEEKSNFERTIFEFRSQAQVHFVSALNVVWPCQP
jgi:hypothetical protein